MKLGSGEDFTMRYFIASTSNKARMIKHRIVRYSGNVNRMEDGKIAFKVLTGEPTGKKPLRKAYPQIERY